MSEYSYMPPTFNDPVNGNAPYGQTNNTVGGEPLLTQTPAQPVAIAGTPLTQRSAQDVALELLLNQVKSDQSSAARKGRLIMAVRAAIGEFFGTFGLMYAAYGSAMASRYGSIMDRASSMIVVSFVAMAMIYSFSAVSGALLNPAVTFGLLVRGKTSRRKFLFYVLAQFLGGIMALLCLYLSYGESREVLEYAVVNAAPEANAGTVFMNELVLTYLLVLVIFKVAFEDVEDSKKQSMSVQGIATTRGLTVYNANSLSRLGFAPIAIGFCIGSLGILGPYSGGVYNPVRVLVPAMFTGNCPYWYMYILGDFTGAALAALTTSIFDKMAKYAAAEHAKSPLMRDHMEAIDY